MNKQELLSSIASRAKVSKEQADNVLKFYEEIVLQELEANKEFVLLNLGKFKIAMRAERSGMNPKTKEPIKIPACNVPKFSPSKRLKEMASKVK
ncbi:DNA-binding protein hu-alpha [Candidatus Mycoplasma haematolamae str. Purdue]|uniref:DNA-binding protein hu-alpha n=1 Tax=Mycoplasma haematolamae (strain Purdue) TaxID=1212765 RepID=I7CJF2_MYCHA|nr:HU family DNA-binding protein [Candidatus Mycoplasma haematolamae]AFO51969.1 DNA-binding protein hu-alpha [Candidatus Mycoplasma haematolamae str. Purdue]